MDQTKTGAVIRTLRKKQRLTQKQLAEQMNISDKAISKWERGLGCPDLSLLPELAEALGVRVETLLSGELETNRPVGGNMNRLSFSVCPHCGNLLIAAGRAELSCCGRRLAPLVPREASGEESLSVVQQEQEFFITSAHEMTKEHYISFLAFLTSDTLILKKLYPEWDLETRIPFFSHGLLLWYCTRHGLFCRSI